MLPVQPLLDSSSNQMSKLFLRLQSVSSVGHMSVLTDDQGSRVQRATEICEANAPTSEFNAEVQALGINFSGEKTFHLEGGCRVILMARSS
jgi:hypothetical protein